jgi:hypothetical protein
MCSEVGGGAGCELGICFAVERFVEVYYPKTSIVSWDGYKM